MALTLKTYVELPAHQGPGGFDHAAVHGERARLYVAHTANSTLDVIDTETDRYLYSVPNLGGCAGALVCEEQDLIFTSNRGENTVSIFNAGAADGGPKVSVGIRPNGMAYDAQRKRLLVAHVGDPALSGSASVAILDVAIRSVIGTLPMPGKTRWVVHDPLSGRFFVNIAEPARIAVIASARPERIAALWEVPSTGPHGLEQDVASHRLFCACDGGQLLTLDSQSGKVLHTLAISGVPDVIFFHPILQRLYVAVGNPGVIDVIDTDRMVLTESMPTERGAKTTALDVRRNKLYVFLSETHRAAVFVDPRGI